MGKEMSCLKIFQQELNESDWTIALRFPANFVENVHWKSIPPPHTHTYTKHFVEHFCFWTFCATSFVFQYSNAMSQKNKT